MTARSSGRRVLIEDATTVSSRSWANPDGSTTVEEVGVPVRFLDNSGVWREIDTTLKADTKGSTMVAASPLGVSLAGESRAAAGGKRSASETDLVALVEPAQLVEDSGEVVSRTAKSDKDGKSKDGTDGEGVGSGRVSVAWPDALPAPTLQGDTARYVDVSPGVDVTVQARRSGWEQLTILKDAAAVEAAVAAGDGVASWDLIVKTDGLDVRGEKDGSVSFIDPARAKDDDGGVVSFIAPMRAWDGSVDERSGERLSETPVAVEVIQDKKDTDRVVLRLTPDQEWLTSKERVFPITIDPTYASASLTATFDTWVDSGQPNLTYHSETELKVGTWDGGGRKLRSYIKFNTSSMSGRQIMSATLDLYETWSWSCTAKPITATDAGNVTTSTKWSNMPATGTAKGSLTVAKGFSSSCPAGTIKIPIKAIAQAWADGTGKAGSGVGVVRLTASETDNFGWKRFRSSETTSPPKLTYTYNRAPGKPSAPTVTGGKTYTPPGGTAAVYTTATKPILTAKSTDADGNKVQILFEALTSTGSSTVVSSCTTPATTSGANATCTLGTALANNSQFVVRAKVKDDQGLWQASASAWTTIRVANSTPPVPSITCEAPFTNGSSHEDLPPSPVQCTASVSGTGHSAPASMTLVINGTSQVVPAASAGSVSKAFTIPKTKRTHVVTATAVSGSGKTSNTASFYVVLGAPSLTRPVTGLASTGTVRVEGALLKPTGTYTARVQWRLAGQEGTETAWTSIGADLATKNNGDLVEVAGNLDLTTIAATDINERVPVTLELRACLIPTGATTCTLGASSATRITRLPNAFGSGYPVDDTAGVGAVALFTGELGVDATDAEYAGQAISRRHTSLGGDGTTAVHVGVFGPGWVGELGAASGMAEAVITDRTKDDGTIVIDDGSGDPLIFGHPSGLRGSYSMTSHGPDYEPVTDITFESEIALRMVDTGAAGAAKYRLQLIEPDGTITAFAPDKALPATVAPTATAITWRPESVTDPEDGGSAEAKTYFYPVSASDHKIKRIVKVPVGKTSANCPGTGDPTPASRGCQYLDITYGASNTGGDREEQVKTITARMWNPATSAMDSKQLASYTYDTAGRLATVTDPRPSTPLITKYGWHGTDSTRLVTVTPPGLAPYRIWYDTVGGVAKVARVTRDNPNSPATYGTLVAGTRPDGSQVLAAYRYGLTPTTITGLDLSGDTPGVGVGRWYQKSAPTQGFAVFDGAAPTAVTDGTATSIAGVTADQWQYADVSFTDVEGYTVNTATYGAGRWLPTSTDYDDKGLITRSLDAAAITTILDTPEVEEDGEVNAMATINYYNEDGLITDTFAPARDVVLSQAVVQGVRTHTKTIYDENPPTDGINPATERKFNLPTRLEVHAADAAESDLSLISVTVTGYGPVSTDGAGSDNYDGWATGNATHSIIKDPSGDASKDITTVTRYDTRHRVIETRQPLAASKSAHAGVTHTRYYTTATHPTDTACGNRPEWEGLVCKTLPGDAPKNDAGTITGAPAPTTLYSYDMWGNTLVETETSVHSGGTTTRTTTNTYDTAGRQTSTALTVSGLAGASGSTARPGTTTVYSTTTGAVTETHLTATPATKESTTYDGWGRIVTATNQDGETSTTTYDTAGRVATLVNPTGTTSYGYGSGATGKDADNKVERRGLATTATVTRAGTGGDLTYRAAYDVAGNLVTHTLPGKITARSEYNLTGDQVSLTYTGQVTPVTESIDPDTGEITWTPGEPVQDQAWLGWTRRYDTLARVKDEHTSHGTSFDGLPGVSDPTDIEAPDTGDAIAYSKAYDYDYAARLVTVRDKVAAGTGISAGPSEEVEDPAFTCIERGYTFDKNGNRTGETSLAHAAAACTTGSPHTSAYTYDTADRPINAPARVTPAGTITGGNYTYDALWRQTLLPAADAPTPEHGNITLGYFDDDLPRVITQGSTSTTFTLDVIGRRHTMSTLTGSLTTTTVNHYDDTTDNPAWTTRTGGGLPNQTLRFTGGIDADLTAIIDGDGDVTLNLSNPAGHLAATVEIPATQASSVPAVGITSWNDYTEYGAPKHTTTAAGSPATTSLGGYGWYADKQRHTSTATAELTLLGVRLYNRVRGLFTAIDPIPGGNTNTYTHPQDPINQQDLDGKWKKWAKRALKATAYMPGVIGTVSNVGFAAYYAYKGDYRRAGAHALGAATFGLTRYTSLVGRAVAKSKTLGLNSKYVGRNKALLTRNNYVRLGWGWKGTAQKGSNHFGLKFGNAKKYKNRPVAQKLRHYYIMKGPR